MSASVSGSRPPAGMFTPVEHALHEYRVHRDPLGHWVVSEAHGLAEGVFFTREAACRFALREADDDASRVHVEPADEAVAY